MIHQWKSETAFRQLLQHESNLSTLSIIKKIMLKPLVKTFQSYYLKYLSNYLAIIYLYLSMLVYNQLNPLLKSWKVLKFWILQNNVKYIRLLIQ